MISNIINKKKKKTQNRTLLTIFFREEEAQRLIGVLNKAYRRYSFEVDISSEGTYEVYVKHSSDNYARVKDDILWFLLDRIAYDLAK